MASLLRSSKNKDKIIYKNYVYQFHSFSRNGKKSYWRCENRDICNARLVTNKNVNDHIHIYKEGQHTHVENGAEVRAKQVVEGIKRRAEQHPNEPPACVIREEIQGIEDQEVLLHLPERTSLLRSVNRSQNVGRPPLPQTLEECTVTPPYDVSLSGEAFLQLDSRENNNRILVFYTKDGLNHLCRSRTIFCDGTFKSVPRLFYQLYTVHGKINDLVFPLIYCLCTRKDEATYTLIFEHLKNAAEASNMNFSPDFVMLDFEMSAINAVRAVLPNSTVSGCLYHFSQAIWRQVVNLGLKVRFTEDVVIRNDIQRLMGLPFIPLDNIEEVFDYLLEISHDDVQDLMTYFETTYLRGRPARGRRRAVPPRFPPQLWNVYERVLNRADRTNNFVEGWHSKFQKMIVTHHATIWKFLDTIKKDQRDNEILLLQLAGGHRQIKYPIRKSYIMNQRQIESIVDQYQEYAQNNNIDLYLRSISYRMKLYNTEESDGEASNI